MAYPYNAFLDNQYSLPSNEYPANFLPATATTTSNNVVLGDLEQPWRYYANDQKVGSKLAKSQDKYNAYLSMLNSLPVGSKKAAKVQKKLDKITAYAQSAIGNAQNLSMDPKNPDEALTSILRREEARRQQLYVPAEKLAIQSLGDTSIIDNARERANFDLTNSAARSNRQRSRYFIQGDPAQKRHADRVAAMDRALGYAQTLNTGRLQQDERNDALRRELIGVGRGIVNNAISGLSQSAQADAQRNAANRMAKAQRDAAGLATFGQLLGAGAAFMA